ncbi:hypothetical protein SNE40_003472 [Patella caerulea]|uniref:Uncharacterized protein n=1 Tax=Patella caerulea TaxID=87958 RepID=A0AAN8KBB5_PATCE
MNPSLILVLAIVVPGVLSVNYTRSCKQLLDVVAIVDSSDSITDGSFNLIKSSLQDIVADLRIGENETRLGIILYSSDITSRIPFSDDPDYLLQAIAELKHAREGTNTALAIEDMIVMFETEGRDGIPKVGIVVTDGISKNTTATIEQAKIAKEANIKMFAVGISSKVNMPELMAIASPGNPVLFGETFHSLGTILQKVVKRSCPERECHDYLEIIAVVDGSDSISSEDFEAVTAALRNLVEEVNVSPQRTRFGVILYSSSITKVISLSDNKTYLLEEINNLTPSRDGTETAMALEEMYRMFVNESRPGVPRIGLVITDGISKNTSSTIEQANLLKTNMSVNMFAVGISNKSDINELTGIASLDRNILTIDYFDDLEHILENIVFMFCPLPVCEASLDILVVVDGSDSISAPEFAALKQSLINLVVDFDIGSNSSEARFGVILYSSNITAIIGFSSNATFLRAEIESLDQPRDGTETALALWTMIEMFNNTDQSRVQRIGIVITDGVSKNPNLTAMYAEEAKNSGIIMFAVGVSSNVDETELMAISDENRMFTAENFYQLSGSLMEIVRNLCPGNGSGNPVTPDGISDTTTDDITTESTFITTVILRTSTIKAPVVSDSVSTTQSAGPVSTTPSTDTFPPAVPVSSTPANVPVPTTPSTISPPTVPDSSTPSKSPVSTTPSTDSVSTTPFTNSISPPAVPDSPTPSKAPVSSTLSTGSVSTTLSTSTISPPAVPDSSTPSKAPASTTPSTGSVSTTLSTSTISPPAVPDSSTPSKAPASTTPSTGSVPTTPSTSSISPPAVPVSSTPANVPEPTTPSTVLPPIVPDSSTGSVATTPSTSTVSPPRVTHSSTQATFDDPAVTTTTMKIPTECDGCRIVNGVGFNSHPDNCNQFVRCISDHEGHISAITQDCPVGLYWDQSLLVCNYPETMKCTKDPCYSQPNGALKPSKNCREYYLCNSDVSYLKCCAEGYGFDVSVGMCVINSRCTHCSLDVPVSKVCELTEVSGDRTSYRDSNGDIRSCPAGTGFVLGTCSCSEFLLNPTTPSVAPPTTSEAACDPALYLPFDQDTSDQSGKNNYVHNEGVTVKNGLAYFNGNSGLRIPRFSNMDFSGTNLVIKIRYRPDGPVTSPQSLVTNADCGTTGPIQLLATSTGTSFKFDTDSSQFSVPNQNLGDWTDVEFFYENGVLLGTAGSNISDPASIVSNIGTVDTISGAITRSHYALQIGRGDLFDFFKGWMEYVYVYIC